MMYGPWDITRNRIFLSFWTIFTHLPPKNPKNQNFEKMKRLSRDIIILHKCTKNHDHMLYCSWDMVHDRCNCYFSFWTIFCPFTLLTARKMKISKKWKKILEVSSFYTSVPKIIIIWYTVPEIWRMTDVPVIFHFGHKNEKNAWISSFYTCVPKIMIWWCTVPEKWCATDGRIEKVTLRGGCPT